MKVLALALLVSAFFTYAAVADGRANQRPTKPSISNICRTLTQGSIEQKRRLKALLILLNSLDGASPQETQAELAKLQATCANK